MIRKSLTTIAIMVKANTRPAFVTTLPVPPIARMMPVFIPAAYFIFHSGYQQQVIVGSHRQKDDHGHRDHHPVQSESQQVLPDEYRQPKR